jgi:hypothetical protein
MIQPGVAGSIPNDVVESLQLTQSFQKHYGSDSASNGNEKQESSWG